MLAPFISLRAPANAFQCRLRAASGSVYWVPPVVLVIIAFWGVFHIEMSLFAGGTQSELLNHTSLIISLS